MSLSNNRTQFAPRSLVLRLEQGPGGDLTGDDDKAIQAGLDYLHRLGGGALQLGAGTFTLRNAVYLRQGVDLRGAGEAQTVLRKAPGYCTALARDADWYENQIVVEDASSFTVGCGVMVCGEVPAGAHYGTSVVKDTVIGIEGQTLFLSRRLEQDGWTAASQRGEAGARATATTAFSMLTAIGERGLNGGSGDAGVRNPVGDLTVSALTLDGNKVANPLSVMSAAADGNYGGAVFLQHAHRIRFEAVTARDWNGDGFSFQVCDDISFDRCTSEGNAILGFHPGSGSQRPRFRDCRSAGNDEGLFFCWGVTDGRVERCVFEDNAKGVTIGHRDTDNVIVDCVIQRNAEVGILCGRSEADYEFFAPHRNVMERCVLRDNGAAGSHAGIRIMHSTHECVVRDCLFESTNANADVQTVGIEIGTEPRRTVLEGNEFCGMTTGVLHHNEEDERAADAARAKL